MFCLRRFNISYGITEIQLHVRVRVVVHVHVLSYLRTKVFYIYLRIKIVLFSKVYNVVQYTCNRIQYVYTYSTCTFESTFVLSYFRTKVRRYFRTFVLPYFRTFVVASLFVPCVYHVSSGSTNIDILPTRRATRTVRVHVHVCCTVSRMGYSDFIIRSTLYIRTVLHSV